MSGLPAFPVNRCREIPPSPARKLILLAVKRCWR
jgi:hypothetical protein